MVSLIRLQRQLLLWLQLLGLQLLDLRGEDRLGRGRRVDARGLDRDDKVAVVLQEVVRVEGDDARLVGLGNVGKHHIDHTDQHAVLVGVAGVLDYWNNVGALLGHIDQVTARSVRELDRVHEAFRSDDVGHV